MLDAAALGLLPLTGARELPGDVLHTELSQTGVSRAFESFAAPGAVHHAAWDAVLGEDELDDWVGSAAQPSHVAQSQVAPEDQIDAIDSGLRQLSRYLSRAWSRAGLQSHQFDDCTQAVFATMLQRDGRSGFDQILGEIGRNGIPEVLNRDTSRGPDFFRAVDMIKKRAQRERSYQSLDEQYELAAPAGHDGASESWRDVLHQAIERSLNQREAELIRATLEGFSPAEIASRWGLAPKTVSNEKTRALQKLRTTLLAELDD
jgi:RNA polymerase sigma factor (sigma-70 family)